MSRAVVYWINGPVLKARTDGPFQMKEAVFVGDYKLAAEVIRLDQDSVTVQVFEDTTGLKPGVEVQGTGLPLAVDLGPGLLGSMFDGIQRPLPQVAAASGDFFRAGVEVAILDPDRYWPFEPKVSPGSEIGPGSVLGEVSEESDLINRVLTPKHITGTLDWIAPRGKYTIDQPIAKVQTKNGIEEIKLRRRWPIREPRAVANRLTPNTPLLTGQRIIDTFFPIAKGGAAATPGGFGTGKTILLQTLAKWCDADIIIYIGCGERGNEMADVLDEFPQLEDPRTGRPLMERTVLIANTSNMPVAAREASIYTGITLAEYYRDQGHQVALFADSISRWAEALREISGRLEELPAEEGYPAYLPTRLAEFFERAGRVQILGGGESSLTVVATVSPPGGDFSEPVTAQTRRFVKTFLSLDRDRAQARFYPAIHPLQSYSGYVNYTEHWWNKHGAVRWGEYRYRMLELLEEQARLERMVKIVGRDALPPAQRLVLVCAEVITEALLRQNAFSENDRFCSSEKQAEMLRIIDYFLEHAHKAVEDGVDPDALLTLPITRRIERMGDDIAGTQLEDFDLLSNEIDAAFGKLNTKAQGAGT